MGKSGLTTWKDSGLNRVPAECGKTGGSVCEQSGGKIRRLRGFRDGDALGTASKCCTGLSFPDVVDESATRSVEPLCLHVHLRVTGRVPMRSHRRFHGTGSVRV